jgi:glycosyltransferase involved in cell wall biosynthesis
MVLRIRGGIAAQLGLPLLCQKAHRGGQFGSGRGAKWRSQEPVVRILLVQEPTAGGATRHCIDLGRALAASGHEVHLTYALRRAEPWLVRELMAASEVRAVQIEMRRAPHVSDLSALARLRAYIRRHGPFDVVHGHSTKGGAIAGLAARAHGVACVFTPHCLRSIDPSLGRLKRMLIQAAERYLVSLADAVIAVSGDEYAHARAMGVGAGKLHVIHNGVARLPLGDRDALRRAWGVAAGAVCIGFIGRLSPQKAPDRLLDAFARIAAARSQLCLAIVGEGALKESLMLQADRLGIAGRIRWLPGDLGPASLAAFDLLVLPSLYEGLPYVVLEAIMAGLPIVASDVGGISAAVRHGETGLIAPNGDPERFAEALARLSDDAALRQRMREQTLARREEFTVDRMVKQTLALYENILRARSPSAAHESAGTRTMHHAPPPQG